MSWPEAQIATTNFDQGTDPPALARTQLLALVAAVNQMILEAPILQAGSGVYAGVAAGTTNALTCSLNPAPADLTDGMHFYVAAAVANTTAVTLQVNTFGPFAVRKRGNVALAAGNIAGAGHILHLVWREAVSRFELLNPHELTVTGVEAGVYSAPTLTIDAQGRVTDATAGSAGFRNIVEWVTPGTYNWTCPANVYSVFAQVWSAGGASATTGWAGAGAGAYGEGYYSVVPGQTYVITVGAGGLGSNTAPTNGGTSSFSTFLSCTGGRAPTTSGTTPGVGGVATGAEFRVNGEAGASRLVTEYNEFGNPTGYRGGLGGTAFMGRPNRLQYVSNTSAVNNGEYAGGYPGGGAPGGGGPAADGGNGLVKLHY